MSRIRGKDTSIEKMLSRALWHRGLRFRKNSPSIYGHPDISIKKYRIAIFCDGDFWHGWNWEERKDSIKSNRDYWIPKIERNMQKDIEVNHALTAMGYTVIRVWEHEIRKNPDAAEVRNSKNGAIEASHCRKRSTSVLMSSRNTFSTSA